jgi:hypothetical protein
LGETARVNKLNQDKFLLEEISAKIRKAKEVLRQIGYDVMDVSVKEFYDYLTGEIFSEDAATLLDVLGNEFLMVHELAEMSELKRMGRMIDKRVIVDLPKTVIYEAHFKALELELEYAMFKKDYFWAKNRLKQHKESVLEDDPNLPESLRPRGEEIFHKFNELIKRHNTLST